jgi:magnesium transporter
MPYKAYYLAPAGELKCGISEAEVKAAFESRQGLLWVDIVETTEGDAEFLSKNFNFHKLAVDDCLSPDMHSPKVDDFDDYLFIVVHGIDHTAESDIVTTTELDLFLGPHYVVSNHNVQLYSINAIRNLVESGGRPMKRGADFLAHAIIDALIDNILPTIDRMSDVAEEIEEEVIRSPQKSTLEAILKLKRSALRIHRVISPQREVLSRLSRGDFKIVGDKALIYYRDVYDHIVRIEDLNQTIRDRSDNALSTHLSSIANRQNEVMKVLSIVASIFLPLALLAGIYGMNFENMPELKCDWGYFAVLGFMGAVIAVMVWWFWVRGWIAREKQRVSHLKPFQVDPEKLIGHVTKRHKQDS